VFRLDTGSTPGAASQSFGKLPKGSILAGALGPQSLGTVTPSQQSLDTVTLVRGSVARPRVERVPVPSDASLSSNNSTVEAAGGGQYWYRQGSRGT